MEGYTDLGVNLICAELGVDDEYAFYISASTGMIVGNVHNTNLLTGNNTDLSYNYVIGEGGNSFNGRLYNGTRNPSVDFVNGKGKSTLGIHATKHGYASPEAYLNDARYFLEKQPTSTTQSFVSRDGTYFRYDTATNEFV